MCVCFVALSSVQRKFRSLRQKVRWALSSQKRVLKSPRSRVLTSRNICSKTHLHLVRSQNKSLALRAGAKEKKGKRRKKISQSSVCGLLKDKQKNKSRRERFSEPTNQNSHDDIDDIFASIGLWSPLASSLLEKMEICSGKNDYFSLDWKLTVISEAQGKHKTTILWTHNFN